MIDFKSINEIVAMMVGIAAFVLFYAFACANRFSRLKLSHALSADLKLASWIKGGMALGIVGLPLLKSVEGSLFGFLLFVVIPDLVLGVVSLSATACLAGFPDPEALSKMDSFGSTLVETVFQGALISGEILLIVVAIKSVRAAWRYWRRSASLVKF